MYLYELCWIALKNEAKVKLLSILSYPHKYTYILMHALHEKSVLSWPHLQENVLVFTYLFQDMFLDRFQRKIACILFYYNYIQMSNPNMC